MSESLVIEFTGEPVGFVYKITNLVNGRDYIGITRQSPERRFDAHWKVSKREDTALYRAMRKYGRLAFSVETLVAAFDADELCRLERKLIAEHRTHARLGGYNMTGGGEGSPDICDETRAKMRVAATLRWHDPETRKKITRSLTGKKRLAASIAKAVAKRLGVPLSLAHRHKISERHKGKIIPAEQREKIAAALRGRKQTQEHIEAARRTHLGSKRSSVTRRRMSAAQSTPEMKEKKSRSSKRSWENLARRERHSNMMKKRWAEWRERQCQAPSL